MSGRPLWALKTARLRLTIKVFRSSLKVTGVVNEQLREVEIVKTTCRKQKRNFSAKEIAIINLKFEENQAVLKSTQTQTLTK